MNIYQNTFDFFLEEKHAFAFKDIQIISQIKSIFMLHLAHRYYFKKQGNRLPRMFQRFQYSQDKNIIPTLSYFRFITFLHMSR